MKKLYKNSQRLLLLLLCVAWQQVAFAQEKSITGKVYDKEDSLPLAGATITVKGTNKGASTDAEGKFKMDAVKSTDVLIVSFIGYINKEATIGSGSVFNIPLSANVSTLKEVVVVGYGTQKKSDVTGAVASVSPKRLNDLPIANFAQALQGSIPGMVVTQNSAGAEGNENSMIIRGKRSIKAKNTPLIILDGIPYNGATSDINPSEIESLTVLKDASSAAIYGSRGSNGVILITTKKGKRKTVYYL